jgi:hypothetical protein
MIELVEKFGNGLKIKFNPTKRNFISVNTHIKKKIIQYSKSVELLLKKLNQ